MLFREYANGLRQLRTLADKNPIEKGFILHGTAWVLSIESKLFNEVNGILIAKGPVTLFYVDIDPNAKSIESEIIRSGIWKQCDCGWLGMNTKTTSILLAKVTPAEKKEFVDGYISDTGAVVLRQV